MPNDPVTTKPWAPLLQRFGFPSPAPAYIRQGDQLELCVFSSLADIQVRFTGYFVGPDGTVQVQTWDPTPPSANSATCLIVDCGEGLVLSLVAWVSGGAFLRGQVYLSARIVTPDPTVSTYVGQLFAGYVDGGSMLSFPGGVQSGQGSGPGAIRSIAGTDPAVDTEISETVPTNTRWRLVGFAATLVTGAAAATRQVHLQITDGSAVVADFPAATTQIISLTRTYFASALGYAPGLTGTDIYIPLAPDLVLTAGWKITTVTDNLNALDNWGAPQLYVEEWVGG